MPINSTAIIHGTVPEVLQKLQLNLSANGDHKTQVRPGIGDTLVVERRYTATWAIMVAIFLFPIGLIALAAEKKVDRGTIAVEDIGDDRVQLTMAGFFYNTTQWTINQLIEAGSREVQA